MNTPPSPDRELHDLLREWHVDRPDDPTLARQVWARIAADQPRGAAAWFENLAHLLARPVMAAAAIAVFAVAGAMAAEWHHAGAREARVTRLAAEYARSIDPILMTTSGADHSGHAP